MGYNKINDSFWYYMRFTFQDYGKLLRKVKDNDKLRQLLQHAFKDPQNIDTFAKVFFKDTVINKSPKFHSHIFKFILDDGNGALGAPRGHGKSSVAGLICLIYCIVNKLEQYIVYISQNHSKTVQFLDPIREEFKHNPLLKFVYGNVTMKTLQDETGKDREDCFDVYGCRVEAVSFEKNLRGFKYRNMRPTLIIGDDMEDDQRVMNPELRTKDDDKLNKIIIPSLDINGRFKMIGTLLHWDSLLAKKIKLYKGKIFKACNPDFTNLLWPDRFTVKKLKEIKHDIGSIAFQQEYLNNPIDNTASLIKREWCEKCRRFDLSYAELQKDVVESESYEFKVEGTDFAFSDRITADKSAFASLAVKDGFKYVFHCETKKGLSVHEQLSYVKNELHTKYAYDQIGLEENSIKAVSKDLSQYDLPLTLYWTSASDPSKSKTDYKNYDYFGKRHTVGKINLIMRLGTEFENGKIVLPYKTEEDKRVTDEIISECTSYALMDGKLVEAGVHPDIPIALGYALELCNNYNGVIIEF